MKGAFIGILLLTGFLSASGTAQVPDLLIYNGDTISLYSNPLEDYFSVNNPRPQTIVESSCVSSACWRGYQAIWLIENNKLYLLELRSCCIWRDYKLSNKILDSLTGVLPRNIVDKLRPPVSNTRRVSIHANEYSDDELKDFLKEKLGRKDFERYRDVIERYSLQPINVADLRGLFKDKFNKGKVWADWFSGILRVPKGKLLDYVHMGYMSTYEYEQTFEVASGNIIEIREFSNAGSNGRVLEGYGLLNAISYSMEVPLSFLNGNDYEYANSDTLEYQTPDQVMIINGFSKFNGSRLNPQQRKERVESSLDSLTKNIGKYKFEQPIRDLSRWGTVGWIDGFDSGSSVFIRVYTIVNINGQMIFYLRVKSKYETFFEVAQNISGSVRLMEFGY